MQKAKTSDESVFNCESFRAVVPLVLPRYVLDKHLLFISRLWFLWLLLLRRRPRGLADERKRNFWGKRSVHFLARASDAGKLSEMKENFARSKYIDALKRCVRDLNVYMLNCISVHCCFVGECLDTFLKWNFFKGGSSDRVKNFFK